MQLHELDATALLDALQRRETSSVEVVQALIARRGAVDGRVGAFIARLDDQALKAAADADARRKSGGEELGLLHGLPLTIKDNIEVAGTDATLGLRQRTGRPAASDAPLVRSLRRAGGIVLGKTNVPQLLLVQESDNEIFGVTRNPWNPQRSPGGSSGGEAAALASGQTPLGIGTDIGGSIRIPAHFAGVCGLKPTLDRWSNRGIHGATDGQELVRAQVGPMARSVRDLVLAMRAISPIEQSSVDPAVPPLPFANELPGLKGLRIGYFSDDGFLTPAPAIQRGVRQAVEALRAAGATVIDYRPPSAQDLLFVWLAGISSDGGRNMERMMLGEAVCRQLRPTLLMARLPGPVRKLAAAVLEGRGDTYIARLLRIIGEKPVSTLWNLTSQRTAMRRAEFDAWNAAQLDAVVCPPHVLPAMPLGTSGDLTLTLSYMFRYVMLNFPAGVVPVTRVRPDETTWSGPGDGQQRLIARRCSEVLSGAAGLPLGVQVIARPYREDVALSVMAAIEAAASQSADYPRTPINPVAG